MTSTSGNVNNNNQESNSQRAADYVAKMDADIASAEADIDFIKKWGPQALQLQEEIAKLEKCPIIPGIKKLIDELNSMNARIKEATDDLNSMCGGFSDFDSAIMALENGTYTVAEDDDANVGEDMNMFDQILDALCDAKLDAFKTAEWRGKMAQDGGDNTALLQDAVNAMKSSTAENGVFSNLKVTIGKYLVALNDQKNAAQTDLDSYRWYDDVCSFGTDEKAKDEDRAIIRNSDDMKAILTGVEGMLAPEMAAAQGEVYAAASLAMDKILDKLKAIIAQFMSGKINAQSAGDQIKCLLALALGILAQIQTVAAQEKAKNQQTEAEATNFATQMNITDQKAQLQQLENDLAYAKAMGTLMKIAKIVVEVAGTLLAPGVGSFLVMAALTIADSAGLMDKLTAEVAKIPGLGSIGAEIAVGAFELMATVLGGMALDMALATATKKVLEVVAKETAEVVAKVVDEAVQKAITAAEASLGRALNDTEKKAVTDLVTKLVTDTVNNAVKAAAEKAVIMFNKQAAATLLPALKAASKEGMTSLASLMAKAAEESAITAAKAAAKTAAEEVGFFAEVAAKGTDVTPAMLKDVSDSAANKAVAEGAGSTEKDVAEATAERSTFRKGLSRAGWTAGYAALSDGALTSATVAAMKKAGLKEDDKEFQIILETIQIIEGILASMVMMYGTGAAQSAYANGSSSALLKLATVAGIAGGGAQAISSGGTAEADLKQANAIQAINEESVSNEMLQMFLKQYNQQGDIDRKNLEAHMADQASNYKLISQLENNAKEAAAVLAQQAV